MAQRFGTESAQLGGLSLRNGNSGKLVRFISNWATTVGKYTRCGKAYFALVLLPCTRKSILQLHDAGQMRSRYHRVNSEAASLYPTHTWRRLRQVSQAPVPCWYHGVQEVRAGGK